MVTITEATRTEDYTNEHGTFAKYLVTLSNGESTSVLRRPDSPDPTGLEVEKKGKGWKVSTGGGTTSSGAKDFKADPVKLRDENRRSALHCAANFAPEGASSQDILKVAQKFYEWIVADD